MVPPPSKVLQRTGRSVVGSSLVAFWQRTQGGSVPRGWRAEPLSAKPVRQQSPAERVVSRDEPIRFLAMEYYLLMWNRSFEVTVTSSSLCGAFVSGAISANSRSVTSARESNDATKLVDRNRLDQARAHEPGSQAYLALHRFNFAIPQVAVAAIRFDPTPKWGMGPVPHSGRLHFDQRGGKSRELILLGQQDGPALLSAASSFGYPVAAA